MSLNPYKTPVERYPDPHLTDEETEFERNFATCAETATINLKAH